MTYGLQEWMPIGAEIRSRRQMFRYSQTHVGNMVGASQSLISNIENGSSNSMAMVIRVCEALFIDLGEFVAKQLGANSEVELKIREDPRLADDDRDLLLGIYKLLVDRQQARALEDVLSMGFFDDADLGTSE